MPKYGKRSRSRLDTCHEDIQIVFDELIKYYDVSVLEGSRSIKKQQEYFNSGKSKCDGVHIKSKHQLKPDENDLLVSYAVDAMPYHKGTNAFSGKEKDFRRFCVMAGYILAIANMLYDKGVISHKIRWGGDWDKDDVLDDQTFDDLPHFELYKPRD